MGRIADEQITGAAIHALARDGRVNLADHIDVRTEGGVVELIGTVLSDGERDAAIEIARQVPGVVQVVDALTVHVDGKLSDRELVEAVAAALGRNPSIQDRVGCRIDDGIVTLIGHIRSPAEEREAMRLAGSVKGVKNVVSALVISEEVPVETVLPLDDPTLADAVAAALLAAGLDVFDPDVRVSNGVAYLCGQVSSEVERRRVEEVAATVAGIRAVHNRLLLRLSPHSHDADEALTARVIQALHEDGRVSPSHVIVVAARGIVYLSGQVDSIEDFNAAVEVVERVPGVIRVANDLVIVDRTSLRSDDKGKRRGIRAT
ncbi:MAG: BON domain-containing protein [Chloroflexi bacterium]|nr:BON domain-containing protein [Chloroflexota bacterium]